MSFKNPAVFNPKAVVESFTVSYQLSGTLPQTTANYERFWTAPAKCVVDSIVYSWAVASASGTVTTEKVPSGTAQGSGTDLQTATVSTAGSANTNNTASLSTTTATLELAEGDALALKDSGNLASIVSLSVTVGLHWIP